MQLNETNKQPVKQPKRMLQDMRHVQLQLVEDAEPGKVRVRGEFARCGTPTENKRVYEQKLWESQFRRLSPALQDRRVLGELDHPTDGRTQLVRVSHIITSLGVEGGKVIGEAEILDTDRGRNLQALLKAGCKIGVSSRGYGSTVENEKGESVVQEDYKLVTFDFVAEPADSTAYPEVFFEGVEIDMDADQELSDKFAKQIEAARAEGADKARESLREEMARTLIAEIAKATEEVRAQVRTEFLSDPAVAGAKAALEAIKEHVRPFILPADAEGVVSEKDAEIKRLKNEVAERDLKVKDLEEENVKLATTARRVGFSYYLERSLQNDPDAEMIRKFVGDVASFESADALKTKVAAVRAEMSKRREEEAQREADRRHLIESAKAEERAKSQVLVEERAKVLDALEKSVQANRELALQLYIERQLTSHPKSAKIRSILESSKVSTKEEVNALIERVGAVTAPATPEAEDLNGVRANLRKQFGAGREADIVAEEKPQTPTRAVKNYNGTGVDLTEFKALVGQQQK